MTNTGSRDGNGDRADVREHAARRLSLAAAPDPKRLEGFQKVFLAAGQTKTVTLPIKIADLAFYNEADKRFEVDQGQYGIQISTSSADGDIQAQDTINVNGKLTQKPSVLSAQPRISGSDTASGISQRVTFPEGAKIDPGLTVAMNDDSLYGWIAPGQSKPLPPGTRLSFSSDRPDVVSVDPTGVIRTVSNGAATVTATATYHGASASTSFVVRVVSDLSDLKVGRATVAHFRPEVFNYDVTLPAGATHAPPVTASARTGTVHVNAGHGHSGGGERHLDRAGRNRRDLHGELRAAASSDEFNGGTLDPKWTVVRPDPANLTVGGGTLTIKPEAGDLVTTTNNAKNLVLQPALGDWTMTSKLTFSAAPNAPTSRAGSSPTRTTTTT